MAPPRTITCATCGKPFTARHAYKPAKTCSNKCRDALRRNLLKLTCKRPGEVAISPAQADAFLAEAVRRETLPPWERHWQPWTDLVVRARQ